MKSFKEFMKEEQELNEFINYSGLSANVRALLDKLTHPRDYKSAIKELYQMLKRDKEDDGRLRHDIYYYASEIAQMFTNVSARDLVKIYAKSGLDMFGAKV